MVLVVLSILTVVGKVAFDGVTRSSQDTLAEEALTSFSAAQVLRHDTVGEFESDPTQAVGLLGSYEYVDGSEVSDSAREISFMVATSSGEDFVAAAVLSPSGRCFMFKVFESESEVQDDRRFFETGGVECSAASATAASGGAAW